MNPDHTPDLYYRAIHDFHTAQLLFKALELDIFSYLDEPVSADVAAVLTGYDKANTTLLLLALSSCGYIIRQDELYHNTVHGAMYLSRQSSYCIAQTILFREKMTSLQNIDTCVRSGSRLKQDSQYDFAALAEVTVPEFYATGRDGHFIREVEDIFTDFSGSYRMLDLGGGSGILAIEFAKHFPNSLATVFEVPAVASVSEKIISGYRMEHRVTVIAGDFNTDDIGSGYDLIVASGILNFTAGSLSDLAAKITGALTDCGCFLLIGQDSDTDSYPPDSMINWLSGYMNGIKPPPSQSRIDAAMQIHQLQPIRSVRSGHFRHTLYQKGGAACSS